MATLDFLSLNKPSLELILSDDTTIHVETPTHGMLLRFQQMQKEAAALKGKTDAKALGKMYDLIAEIMSINREGIKLTGDDLRNRYGFEPYHLLAFEHGYLEFINEIKQAKN